MWGVSESKWVVNKIIPTNANHRVKCETVSIDHKEFDIDSLAYELGHYQSSQSVPTQESPHTQTNTHIHTHSHTFI